MGGVEARDAAINILPYTGQPFTTKKYPAIFMAVVLRLRNLALKKGRMMSCPLLTKLSNYRSLKSHTCLS